MRCLLVPRASQNVTGLPPHHHGYERMPAGHEAMILRAMIALMTRQLTSPSFYQTLT